MIARLPRQLLRRRAVAIIRKPTVSMPSERASPKCCIDTSASVQCVAIARDPARPPARASRRSSIVPMPGTSRTAILAWLASSTAARIRSISFVREKP